jgi:predicted nucleic acid-binding protein
MARVFFDTNLWIYLFEDSGVLSDRVFQIRERMIDRGDRLLTATIAVGEVLVKPQAAGDRDTLRHYTAMFADPEITVIPFDWQAALIFPQMRGLGVRPADAIQLACAAVGKADLFLTNDVRLTELPIPYIPFVTTMERAPL